MRQDDKWAIYVRRPDGGKPIDVRYGSDAKNLNIRTKISIIEIFETVQETFETPSNVLVIFFSVVKKLHVIESYFKRFQRGVFNWPANELELH